MIVTNLAIVYSESCNDPWMQLKMIVMKADVLLPDLVMIKPGMCFGIEIFNL